MIVQDRALAITRAVGELHLEGNIIPHEWYKHLKHGDGKPDTTAIILLSEIVYWYRPRVEKDERSGRVIGYYKRFKGDKLQRSHGSFADQFGFTKRQVRSALDYLETCGVITTELRDLTLANGMRLANVLFIEIVPERLRVISTPCAVQDHPSDLRVTGYDTGVIANDTQVAGSDVEVARWDTEGIPSHTVCHTNTETTPEITLENTPQIPDVVAALQRLGLTRHQASAVQAKHRLTEADVRLWAEWKATITGAARPVAVLAALIKTQRLPPRLSTPTPNLPDTIGASSPSAEVTIEVRELDGTTAPKHVGVVWQVALQQLMAQTTSQAYETWLRPARLLDVLDGAAIIGTPNIFVRQEIESQYLPILREALTVALGYEVGIQVVIAVHDTG